MLYDLDAVAAACARVGIEILDRSAHALRLGLGPGDVLVLANDAGGSIRYFEGNAHHQHDDFVFDLVEPAPVLKLAPVALVEALASGEVLVAELHEAPHPPEMFLLFYRCDMRTEIDPGQELRIRRAGTVEPAPRSLRQRWQDKLRHRPEFDQP